MNAKTFTSLEFESETHTITFERCQYHGYKISLWIITNNLFGDGLVKTKSYDYIFIGTNFKEALATYRFLQRQPIEVITAMWEANTPEHIKESLGYGEHPKHITVSTSGDTTTFVIPKEIEARAVYHDLAYLAHSHGVGDFYRCFKIHNEHLEEMVECVERFRVLGVQVDWVSNYTGGSES